MSDNLKKVYSTLQNEGYELPKYEEFEADMRDDKLLGEVRQSLVDAGYTPPEFDEFKFDMWGTTPAPTDKSQYTFTGQQLGLPEEDDMRSMTVERKTSMPTPMWGTISVGENRREPVKDFGSASNGQGGISEYIEMLSGVKSEGQEKAEEQMRIAKERAARGERNWHPYGDTKKPLIESPDIRIGAADNVGLGSPSFNADIYADEAVRRAEEGLKPADGWTEATKRAQANIANKNRQAQIKKAAEDAVGELRIKSNELSRRYEEADAKRPKIAIGNPTSFGGVLTEQGYYDRDYRNLNAANNILKKTEDMMADFASKQENGRLYNLGRGLVTSTFDPDNWDFGFGDANVAERLLSVVEKADKDEPLSESEQLLLDAAINQQVMQGYYSELSGWQKAGKMFGESLPFMAQIAVNPLGSMSKYAGSKAAKAVLKHISKKVSKKAIERILARTAGLTAQTLGDLGTSYGMALTTNFSDTAADALNRQIGNIQYDYDDNGVARYNGRINVKEAGEAWLDAINNKGFEFYSEKMGNYFAPILKGMGKLGGKALKNFGMDGVNRWVSDFAKKGSVRQLNQFFDKTQFHGFASEYAEEIANGMLNAAFVGDMTMEDVFSKDNLIDTAIGLSVMGAIGPMVGTAGYARAKYKEKQALNEADEEGRRLMGHAWDYFADAVRRSKNGEELSANLRETLNSFGRKALPGEDMRQILSYAQAYNRYKAVEEVSAAAVAEGVMDERDLELQRQYESGQTTTDKHGLRLTYEAAADAVKDVIPLNIGENTAYDIADEYDEQGDADTATAIRVFLSARAAHSGMTAQIREQAQSELESANAEIDSHTNKTDGNIYSVTLGGGLNGYVTGGTVITDSDGDIDIDATREANEGGYIYVNVDGVVKPKSVDDFVSLDGVESAADAKAMREAEINAALNAQYEALTAPVETQEATSASTEVTPESAAPAETAAAPVNNTPAVSEVAENAARALGLSVDELNDAIKDEQKGLQIAANYDRVDDTDSADAIRAYVAERFGTPAVQPAQVNNATAAEVGNNGADKREQSTSSLDAMSSESNLGEANGAENIPAPENVAPIPVEKRGKEERQAFHLVPVERTTEELYNSGLTQQEIDAFVQANIDEINSDIEKHSKKQPKMGANIAAYKAAKEEWQAQNEDLSARLNYYKGLQEHIKGITTSNTAEAINDPIANVSDITTPEEFIAALLGGIKITPESFRKETGLSATEQKALVGVIAGKDKGGVSIERAAEIITDNYSEELAGLGFKGDMMDVRNAIIDILSGGNPKTYAKRAAEARQMQVVDERRDQMDYIARQLEFDSVDEMIAYEETLLPRIIEQYAGFDEQTYYSILVNDYNNDYDTTRESETVGRGGEVLQDEQPTNANGTKPVGTGQQGGAATSSVQSNGANVATPGNQEVSKPVGNSEQLNQSGDNTEMGARLTNEVITDNQGNPVDADGKLVVDEVNSIDEITDEDFETPTRNVQLPAIPENVANAIGTNGRPIVIKKNVFEKNGNTHVELEPEDSRNILRSALYNPNLVGSTQPIRRPDYKVAIRTGEQNAVVVLDVYQEKDFVEIVGWRMVNEKGLAKMQRQAEREGGQFLILSPNDGSAAALSALPLGLSSEGESTTQSANSQENSVKSGENTQNGGEISQGIEDNSTTGGESGSSEIPNNSTISQNSEQVGDQVEDEKVLSESKYADVRSAEIMADNINLDDVEAYNMALDEYPKYIGDMIKSGKLSQIYKKATVGERIALNKMIQAAGYEISDVNTQEVKEESKKAESKFKVGDVVTATFGDGSVVSGAIEKIEDGKIKIRSNGRLYPVDESKIGKGVELQRGSLSLESENPAFAAATEKTMQALQETGVEVVMATEKQVKAMMGADFSRAAAPFYSNARKAVLDIKQEKATPEQWVAMLKKNGGLKAGEDAWIGLEAWLNNQQGTVTKQEILDYLTENSIQIEEVEYAQFGYGLMDEAARNIEAEAKAIGWDAVQEKYPGIEEFFEFDNGEILWSEEKADVGEYEDFIIDNGLVDVNPGNNAINETRERYTTEGLERKREIALTVPTVEPYNESDNIHFGDAGGGRAVAWVRFGETIDSEGKRVLVIDEIQSKRHQDGREKGYKDKQASERERAAIEVLRYAAVAHNEYRKELEKKYGYSDFTGSLRERTKRFYNSLTQDELLRLGELKQAEEDARDARDRAYDAANNAIPSAPFEKNWHELAMKRMLRLAAEEGFDKVAWTTGEQQAERYDMSRQVESISVEENTTEEFSDGTPVAKNIIISTANGMDIRIDTDAEGVIHGGEYGGKRLSDVLGKEIAEKIMQPGSFKLEGDGLRIGGEGMKGFYDKMLPSFVQKYTKKWGAKVGEVTMPDLKENNTMHSVDVTPEMRESVMQGQPMFHRVYHGSGAKFDRFDHSFMGTGEGAQAFGWGTYVTEVKGIGRTYAESTSGNIFKSGFGDFYLKKIREGLAEGKSFEEIKQNLLESHAHLYEQVDGNTEMYGEFISDYEKFQSLKEEDLPKRNLYTVEIPDDNGSNYLHWDDPINGEIQERVANGLQSIGFEFEPEMNHLAYSRDGKIAVLNINAKGKDLYAELSEALGGDKAASQFLNDLSFVGISYPAEATTGGRADSARNYVIFKENDAQITDRVEFLRTSDGAVYGWAVNGKIFLTPDGINPNTPVHEYTHLWASAIEQRDPKMWRKIVEAMKQSPVWNEVMADEAYRDIWNDDNRVASEVLSRLSGNENYRRTVQEAAERENDPTKKFGLIAALGRVKRALADFWNTIKGLFSADNATPWERFVNSAIGDFYKGVNPNVGTFSNEDNDIRFRSVGGNSGYVGYSMSKRAAEAREEGRFPKTDFKKEYNMPQQTLDALVEAGVIDNSEWHHTSKMGNRTTFYGWADEAFAEMYAENRKEIDALVKDVNANIAELEKEEKDFLDSWRGYQYPESFDWDAYGRRARELGDLPYNERMDILRSEFPETAEKEKHDSRQREFSREIDNKKREQRKRINELFDREIKRVNDGIISAVNKLAAELHTDVEIVNEVSDIPDTRKRGTKGWYDGRVYLVLPNATSVDDAVETVLHEVVGHKGLRALFGEGFNDMLADVFKNAPKQIRKAILDRALNMMAEGRKDFLHVATEEYLAEQAERGFDDYSFLDKAKGWILKLLRSIGLKSKISDSEIRYMLWRNYNLLKGNNTLAEIENIAMQARLGVGEYRARGEVIDVNHRDTSNAQEQYNKNVEGFTDRVKEAWIDKTRSVKKMQEAIEKETGNKIADYANVYLLMNQMPGRVREKMDKFLKKHLDPLGEFLKKMFKNDYLKGSEEQKQKQVERYLNCKHGIERNIDMSVRAALTNEEGVLDRKTYEQYTTEKEAVWEKNLPWAEEVKELTELSKKYNAKEKDYSGLTALFPSEDSYKKIRSKAIKRVEDFENAFDKKVIDELWKRVGDINELTLKESYKSGLLSNDLYSSIKRQFKYYVPLRGFEETTADEVYEYLSREDIPISGPIRRAEGRKSEAEKIFATMANMYNSAVSMGAKNRIKQALFQMAVMNKTSLLSVNPSYYKEDGRGGYEPFLPSITDNMSEDEIREEMEKYEEDVKKGLKDGTIKRHREGLNIDYKSEKWQRDEHAVRVKRNGKEFVVFVNGSPRVAQAVNGLLDKRGGKFIQTLQAANRWRARNITGYNVNFTLSNLARDIQEATITAFAKEGIAYAWKFEKELMKNLAAFRAEDGVKYRGIHNLYYRYFKDELDLTDKREKYFKEFMENGGETGFHSMMSIEDYQKRIKKAVDSNLLNATGKGFAAINDTVEFVNRGIENACRFATYVASRESGKSIMQSVNDAKEASVNFNRVGSGAMGNLYFRASKMFLNPAIQGLVKRLTLLRDHPARMTPIVAMELLTGYIVGDLAMMAMKFIWDALGFDDDDEENNAYYNLSDFVRRSNVIIPLVDGKFIKIPLSHESRVAHGIGEILSSYKNGHLEYENIPAQVYAVLTQAIPLNPTAPDSFTDENLLEDIAKVLIPDAFALPAYEALALNRDFTGRRITGRSDYNEHRPEYMRAGKGTPEFFIEMSRTINDWTGGSDIERGVLENAVGGVNNPTFYEYMLIANLGGIATMTAQLYKTALALKGDEEYQEARNYPIINRFFEDTSSYEEKPQERTRRDYERAYRFFKEKVKDYSDVLNNYKAAENMGIDGLEDELEDIKGEKMEEKRDAFKPYKQDLDELYDDLNEAKDKKDRSKIKEIEKDILEKKIEAVKEMEKEFSWE